VGSLRALLLCFTLSGCTEAIRPPSSCSEARAELAEARDSLNRLQLAAEQGVDVGDALEEAAVRYEAARLAVKGC
jgi:hypothetical protein